MTNDSEEILEKLTPSLSDRAKAKFPHLIKRPVELQLVGLNGNAFSILGAFAKAARQQGWSRDEVEVVRDYAMEGDYDHLLATIMVFTKSPGGQDDEYSEGEAEEINE